MLYQWYTFEKSLKPWGWMQLPDFEPLHHMMATQFTDEELLPFLDVDLSVPPFPSSVLLQKRLATLAFPLTPVLIPFTGHQ